MSLKQQIDYALRDGIVSKSQHKQLITEPYVISRLYNVNPYYFFSKSSDYLNDVQSIFLKQFKGIRNTEPGAYFVNCANLSDQLQMMAAVLIRNAIPAYYYTVDNLLEFIKLDYGNKFTFINSTMFITGLNGETAEDLRYPFVNFMNFAQDNNIFLVLHFASVSNIVTCLSEYWYKVISSDFYLVEHKGVPCLQM